MMTDFMSTILRIGNISDIVEAEHIIIERIIKATSDPTIKEVSFWNFEFTTGIIEALRKLIHCDTRHFTIKILSCRGLVADAVSTLVTGADVEVEENIVGAVHTLVLNGPVLENHTVTALRGQRSLKRLRLLGIRSEYHDVIDIGNCMELDLTHSRIFMTPDCCLIGSLARSQHLECLKLDFCNLSDSELCRMLQVCPNATLRELHLSHNNCADESMNILVHRLLVDSTSSLSILNLHHQTTKTPIPWKPLFEALKHPSCYSLKELDISGNPLAESDITVLAESLKFNSSLQSLNLHDCQISPKSSSILASQMPHWTAKLHTLDLSGSHFLCAQHSLVSGLKHNYYLENVGSLYYCPCTNELEFYLDCNRCGRRLLKEVAHKNHRVPLGLWPDLLARIPQRLPMLYSAQSGKRLGRRESALYYFLRHGPAMMEQR
jgi:hypothetical protein